MAVGIDCKTYKGATGAGGRITLARPASTLALSAQGAAIFWVRPSLNASGAPPVATPDPANNAFADGWIRVSGADGAPNGGANNVPLPDGQKIAVLDVWCEAAGYLVAIASEGLPAAVRNA